mgnify:CR=1 FL=1
MEDLTTIKIAFIIDNHFSMFELSQIMEPLNLAFNSADNIQHQLDIYSCDGRNKTASCGSVIASKHICSLADVPSMIFIMSPLHAPFASSLLYKQLKPALQSDDCSIVGVAEGIQWLYKHKVIDGNYISNGIIEATSSTSVNLKKGLLYSVRNNITLCAGGSACLDMTLKLISILHNKELSINTAEELSCSVIRSSRHHRFETTSYTTAWPQDLRDACLLMSNNLKEPLKITEICQHLELTAYQLHQLFKQHIGTPPNKYYYDLRIMRVQNLLSETNLSIRDIANETGYSNLSTLYKRFKKRFGTAPCHFKKYSAF